MSIAQILLFLIGIALAEGDQEGQGPTYDCDTEGMYWCTVGECTTPSYKCSTEVGDGCPGGACYPKTGGAAQICSSNLMCELDPENNNNPPEKVCSEGWIELEGCSGGEVICIKMERPIKFISWTHMMYECDSIGGFLPEPSTTNTIQFNLLVKSYEQLYGETMVYLGATDVTHSGSWKWLNGGTEAVAVNDAKWTKAPVPAENKGCMAQVSTADGKYVDVDCEEDSSDTQVAFMCMAAKA